MKTLPSKKTIWYSLVSLAVMGIFILFATGSFYLTQVLLSIPIESETKYMGNDEYQESTLIGGDMNDAYIILYDYKIDAQGRKHGPMTRTSGFYTSNLGYVKETVNMIHGLRHGEATTTYGDGSLSYRCYNMGVPVDCNKAAHKTETKTSTYQIINNKYPWYISSLNAFGFNNEYIESFTDSIENIMYSFEFEEEDFGEYFNIALDSLKLTPYDSLINLYPVINYKYGLELLKNNELRLAIIDYNRTSENSTFSIVNTTYSGYLLALHNAKDPELDFNEFRNDFESFCMLVDSLMESYIALDMEDPFFIDSVDVRIHRAINTIAEMDESSSNSLVALKSILLEKQANTFNKSRNIFTSELNKLLLNISPNDMAESVLIEMFREYLKGNVLIYSALEAYHIKNNGDIPPTITTELNSEISSTSAIIIGNIIESGSEDITEKGIVWATSHNPTIGDNVEKSETGSVSFNVTINGLTEGLTYYARAYAVSEAGTSYGNCISFITQNTVSIDKNWENDIRVKVYPNPASNKVRIETNFTKPVTLHINSIDGKQLKHITEFQDGEVDISNFTNGIYIIQITDHEITISKKLFVR